MCLQEFSSYVLRVLTEPLWHDRKGENPVPGISRIARYRAPQPVTEAVVLLAVHLEGEAHVVAPRVRVGDVLPGRGDDGDVPPHVTQARTLDERS